MICLWWAASASRYWGRSSDEAKSYCAARAKVVHVRFVDQKLEQFERRYVEPLQIIEEQREGMLRTGKHTEEP